MDIEGGWILPARMGRNGCRRTNGGELVPAASTAAV
jgi:hypothetical protein